MRWRNLRDIGAYVLVALFGVGSAAVLSLKFLNPAVSQEAEVQNEQEKEEEASPSPAVQAQEQEPPAPPPEPLSQPFHGYLDPPQRDPEPEQNQNNQGAPPAAMPQTAGEEPVLPPVYEEEKAAEEAIGPRPTFPVDEGGMVSSARELEVFLEPFIYESGGRKSPFEPFEERTGAEKGPPMGPLQRFSLNELRLIGIMWDIKNPKAMFVDPDSLVHVVGRDEGIGRKNGYIAAIREGEVVVVEAEQKESGIVYETKVIQLLR